MKDQDALEWMASVTTSLALLAVVMILVVFVEMVGAPLVVGWSVYTLWRFGALGWRMWRGRD